MANKTCIYKIISFFMAAVISLGTIVFTTSKTAQAAVIDPNTLQQNDIVYFGSYPQESLGKVGAVPVPAGTEGVDWIKDVNVKDSGALYYYAIQPIAWKVVQSSSNNELFLVTSMNIDCRPYNDVNVEGGIKWEEAPIRSWLNQATGASYMEKGFIGRAFSSEQQNAIKPTTVQNYNNPPEYTAGGTPTTDQLFLLSVPEIKLFPSNAKNGFNTDFSDQKDTVRLGSGNADWFYLRSVGTGTYGMVYVSENAGIEYSLNGYLYWPLGIRPAFKLDLSKVSIESVSGKNLVRVNPAVTWPTGLTATYGQTLEDVSLAGQGTGDGTFSWTANADSVGIVGTQTHNMTFTPSDTTQYNILTANVDVVVNKKTLTWNTDGTVQAKTYDGGTTATAATQPTLNGVVFGDDVSVTNGTVSFNSPNAGASVGVTAIGYGIADANTAYYNAPADQPVFANGTINPKEITFTIDAITNQTYIGSAITPSLTVKDGDTALTAETDYTVSYSANTDAGTAGVSVTGAGNYMGSSGSANFTIIKANPPADVTTNFNAVKNYAHSYSYDLSGLLPTVAGSFGTPVTYALGAVTNTESVLSGTPSLSGSVLTIPVGLVPAAGKTAIIPVTVSSRNYNDFTITVTVNTIDTIPLTVTGLTVANKTYDGTASATVNGTPALAGVVSDDDVTLSGTASAQFSNANAGDNKPVTISGLSLTGDDAVKYSLDLSGYKANITPKPLTSGMITVDGGPFTYDRTAQTPGITVTDGATLLTLDTDYESVTYSNHTNAGTASVSITGKGNYSGTPTAYFTIDKKQLTWNTDGTVSNRAYNGTTSATVANLPTFNGVITNDTVNVSTGTVSFSDANAGTGKTVTATGFDMAAGGDSANYIAPSSQPVFANEDITQATLTITGGTASDKEYDGTDTAAVTHVTFSGMQNGETLALETDYTVSNTHFSDANVGTGKTVSGTVTLSSTAKANNYSLSGTSLTGVTASITKKLQTGFAFGAVSPVGKTYGDSDFTLTATGGQSTGSVSYAVTSGADVVSVNGSTGEVHILKAGSAVITATRAGDTNYEPAAATIDVHVSPKALTVDTVTAANKTFDGNTATTATITYTGVVSGDNVTATATGTFEDMNAGIGKTVTISNVVVKGNDNGNYKMPASYSTTTADIMQASSLTATNPSDFSVRQLTARAYSFDLNTIALSANDYGSPKTYSVGTTTDFDSVLDGSPSIDSDGHTLKFTTSNTCISGSALTIPITIATQNYTDAAATLTVNVVERSPVTFEGLTVADKVYDAQPFATSGTLEVKENGLPVPVTPTYLYTSTDGGSYSSSAPPTNAGAYKLTLSVDTADYIGSADYPFSITKKALTITADNKSFIVGGSALPDFTATVSGLVSGEGLVTQPSYDCSATTGSPAGEYDIIPKDAVATDNYTITSYVKGTLTISDVSLFALTVTAGTGGAVNNAGGNYAAGAQVTITATPNSGYNFAGWTTSNGGTFGNASTASTTFTMPSNATTVTASFTAINDNNNGGNSSSGGSGGSYTEAAPAATGVSGATINSPATVTANGVTKTIVTLAQAQAALGNTTAANTVITVVSSNGTDTLFEKSSVKAVADKENISLTVKSGNASVTFSSSALAAIASQATGDISVHAALADTGSLTDIQKAAVGNRPVYDLSVLSNDVKINNFNGSVTVDAPYKPLSGENHNAVVVYYVNAKGEMEIVENGVYDPATGQVTFTVTHFSLYMIGYNYVSFNDVASGYWSKAAIDFAAARNLVSGVGNGSYDPNRAITRAEFIQMIQNVLKLPAGTGAGAYADVTSDAWYYNAVMAAKKVGLFNGLALDGNNFLPNQSITREEMAVILANVAIHKGMAAKKTVDLTKFKDYEAIRHEYLEKLKIAIANGFMSPDGMGNGSFDPQGVTTRAQAAQVQRNLLDVLK